MKNNKKVSLWVLTVLCFTSTLFFAKSQEKDEGYWQKMVTRISALFTHKKDIHEESIKQKPAKKPSTSVKNSTDQKASSSPMAPKQEMSRDQAIEAIKKITTKLFDAKDTTHISLHLNEMKEFTKFLDDAQDKKLIAAIHFLLMNHHRSGAGDILFWLKANNEHQFDTIIPMTPEVAAKPTAEKRKLLLQKMAIKA